MRYVWAIVALIAAVNIVLGLLARRSRARRFVNDPETRRLAISSALAALRARTNDDAFVIFEDARSRKFVQFAGGVNHPLLLDLPIVGLHPSEVARAAEF